MGTQLAHSRTRWGIRPRSSPRRDTTAIQVFYDIDGEPSSTASLFIEDEIDDSPIPTGILDQDGNQIYQIPWRDTVPIGFHYKPEDYDEDGDYIGSDEME